MAKKREVNYFKEISSDEELEKFLNQQGLLVLDVYQDLFGPTISLHGTLQKVKLALSNSDKLQLGVCDAYKVDKLKRFKNKCQPTMIFCSHGSVVEIVYGSNIPSLLKALHNQLELEELCESGEATRVCYDFDEPLPLEMEEIERKRAEDDAKMKAETSRVETELRAKWDEIIESFATNGSDMGVTMFMPHVAKDAYKRCLETSKWLGLVSRSRRMVQIDAKTMSMLNYKLENPMPDEILERIYEQDIFVVLWQQNLHENEAIEKILDDFVRNVSEPRQRESALGEELVPGGGIIQPRILNPLIIYLDDNPKDSIDTIATTRTTSIDGDKSTRASSNNMKPDIVRQSLDDRGEASSRQSQVLVVDKAERISMTDRESIPKRQQSSSRSLVRLSRATLLSQTMMGHEEDDRPKLVIPAVFTPANHAGNAMLMYHFFRNHFDYFLPPEVEADPEHLLMAFPATKRHEIFELCKDYPKELLAYGFFTSADIHATKLICKTHERYDKLDDAIKLESDRILMKVALRTDHFMLALTAMHIVYVSLNALVGAEECKIVFDEEFMAMEDPSEDGEEPQQADDIRQRRSSQGKPLRLSQNL